VFRAAEQKAAGAETSSEYASFHQLWTVSTRGLPDVFIKCVVHC